MSTIVSLWQLANLLGVALVAFEAFNLRDFPLLQPHAADEPVDVVVAMRNEAANASAFLECVLACERVARVLVADDRSEDETPAILERYALRDARVQIVRCAGAGKNAALASAVAAPGPRAPWLLFLDADVRIDRGAPGALIAFARKRSAAAASAWPRVRVAGAAGLLLGPLVTLFLLQFLPMRIARTGNLSASAGNGQCFLVDAAAYDACGGHAAIRAVVEDVALARALKRAGFGVALGSAAAIATVEGYASIPQGIAGYARSLYFGAGVAGCIVTLLWLVMLLAAPVQLYAARMLTARRMRESAASVALAPAGVALACAAALYALIAGAAGRLRWRGRTLAQ